MLHAAVYRPGRLGLLHDVGFGAVNGHLRKKSRGPIGGRGRRDAEAVDVVLWFEIFVAEVEILQCGDRPGFPPGVFPVSFATVSARPGPVEVLQGHVRNIKRKHLFDLVAQVGVGGVIGERDHGYHVLHVVLGRIVFMVAVDGRSLDHAQDPARGLGPIGFRGQAVPHAFRVRPPLRRQQVAHVEHQPVVLRVAALEDAVHHEIPDDSQCFFRQPVGPTGDERTTGIHVERSTGRPAAPSVRLIGQ